MKRKNKPIGRMINGVVFGLSTPRRHGNAKSSSFMEEIGMPLGKPKESYPNWSPLKSSGPINRPNRVGFRK